ncbi:MULTISPECIES: adaptor protein MecA [Staphylococcus]|uniref:adaptor protein MecA n=1 Tax=Staphylococcus TaxID=1279 RepID=UPI0008A2FF2B|nr:MULTISPECIES: adaptor protein MecA [Staphylococcus]ARB78183.1 adaptor protein MecA [Staphylococcus lugdunensis]ARJ19305.1 adaptor protein MecA [Staphylococcus lugdunensis]MBM7133124.1 adaptor protein MecA [Staphylococcus lugdunensis]MCH8641518.1 adaptor protein MecA [Staphylococcus lugdunensis]MCH8645029.1 adaptor protein MecA [Staphylococcus lugdunensis]
MRIERVDETTVKLFITYSDIEARGFSREDLWTNRKRGEEFFWSMMDEINQEEEFVVEGPLWIQVHAFEKGVEVLISKSKNDEAMDKAMNMSDDDANDQFDQQLNELLAASALDKDQKADDMFEQRANNKSTNKSDTVQSQRANMRTIIVKFDDLEHVIDYAYHHNQATDSYEDLLYMLDSNYYYAVHFDEKVEQEDINDFYSQLLEYAYPTDKTEVYLDDYGKIIMSYNVTAQVRRYFPDTAE